MKNCAETTKKKLIEVETLKLAAPAAVNKYREKAFDASKLMKVELALAVVLMVV